MRLRLPTGVIEFTRRTTNQTLVSLLNLSLTCVLGREGGVRRQFEVARRAPLLSTQVFEQNLEPDSN